MSFSLPGQHQIQGTPEPETYEQQCSCPCLRRVSKALLVRSTVATCRTPRKPVHTYRACEAQEEHHARLAAPSAEQCHACQVSDKPRSRETLSFGMLSAVVCTWLFSQTATRCAGNL